MNQQNEGIRDARTLGIPKMLVLGLQHMFAMFGATILVPILVDGYFEGEGLSIQVTLICAGLGTLFFHLCAKLKVPAFLGSSFAFLGGFQTVANLDTGIFAGMSMGEKLPYACGGIVVAGALYLVLALIIKVIGVKKVMRFLPPVVTGPIIICIGLSLAPSAVSNASTNWLLAIIAFGTIVIFNIWGKGMAKIIPILLGVVTLSKFLGIPLPWIRMSVIGALTYVALYMLKTFVFQKFVYGFPAETVWATMLSKLPGSLINALAAMIVAPILYTALRSALERAHILDKMRK